MLRKIKIHGYRWIDAAGLSEEEIKEVLWEFNFHELDVEACLEDNQTARIDAYDNYLFIILHFPKYNTRTKTYNLNEFKIFIWDNFIITLQNYGWDHINKIYEKYKTAKHDKDKQVKLSPAYILYEIIQVMLEKMFNVSWNFKRDMRQIENQVFDNADAHLVKEIMTKKRNIVVLKHMFTPQIHVLKRIEFHINELFSQQIEVYFEDLEDKLDHIVNNIRVLEEYIDSVEDAFKTLIDIKTNFILKILALFSAFLLPLTLITSFYWMNINLPFGNNSIFVYILLSVSSLVMMAIYFIFKRSGKF